MPIASRATSPGYTGIDRRQTRLLYGLIVLYVLFTAGGCSEQSANEQFQTYRFLTRDDGAYDSWPCFSPDGETILFSRTVDKWKTWKPYVVPVQSGKPRLFPMTDDSVSVTRPNWFPNNSRIAFTGISADHSHDIWLANPDGTNPQAISANGLSRNVLYPSWYPDGDNLAVVDMGDGKGGIIKRVNITTHSVVALTDRQQILAGMPRVSPDGKSIAFAGQKNRGKGYDQNNNRIWLINPAGELRQLDARQGRTPAWSPDGKWIAFESKQGSNNGRYAIFVESVDGDRVMQLTRFSLDAHHPSWSPDGKYLVFSASFPDRDHESGIVLMEMPDFEPRTAPGDPAESPHY